MYRSLEAVALLVAVFIISAVLVAVAELGDKTQMLTLVLAARHGARSVLLGVAAAILALQLVAVVAGGLVGALIPAALLAWVTGLLFVAFGVWTLLRQGESEDVGAEAQRGVGRGPVVGTASAFFLAELGDKTQIMTMTIATDPAAAASSLGIFAPGVVPSGGGWTMLAAVWLGSVVGMLAINGAAALIGHAAGSRLPPKLIARVSGAVFILFGVLTIAGALTRAG